MLTGEQITHFHALGFVKVEGALTPAEVDEFSWRFDEIIARGETQGDSSEAGARIFPDGHRVILPLIEADPYFYNLLDHPNLAAIAEDLLGDDCIFYGSSDGQLHDGDTNWHRDGGSPEPAIEAKLTFYLDEVAPGKGCLSFIPGSHARGSSPHLPCHRSPNQSIRPVVYGCRESVRCGPFPKMLGSSVNSATIVAPKNSRRCS